MYSVIIISGYYFSEVIYKKIGVYFDLKEKIIVLNDYEKNNYPSLTQFYGNCDIKEKLVEKFGELNLYKIFQKNNISSNPEFGYSELDLRNLAFPWKSLSNMNELLPKIEKLVNS